MTAGVTARRFGFSAGYLMHLPPPSCGAKGLRTREKEKLNEDAVWG